MVGRTIAHGRTGETLLLYPRPLTPADRARYAHVFTPAFGQWLRAWLGDQAELPAEAIDRVMADWAADGQVAEGGHA